MQLSERMQIERYELGDASNDSALRIRGGVAVGALTVALSALAATLLVATVSAFEGWAHLIVIGAIIATAVGLMIAVAPQRRV